MRRRIRRGPAEGLVEVSTCVPWWHLVASAVVNYVVLRAYQASPLPVVQSTANAGKSISSVVTRGLATAGQFVLLILFTISAILSGIWVYLERGISVLTDIAGFEAPNHSLNATPSCPRCKAALVQRRTRRGKNVDEAIWGFAYYPNSTGTRPMI